ncbi:MAG: aspartate carbamoyltransferase [Oscillospiraceae bacterium]|nr:aspartate carbamoyltransferase [Oscillospiraceae bacterium]
MGLESRNLISTLDFSIEEQDEVLALAERIMAAPKEYDHLLGGRIMASLFFEPSTRTRLSFEAAMLRLGGRVIGFSEAGSSSAAKGESLSDTIRTVSQYADIIVVRHPKEGAANIAAGVSGVPVVNAGDGGHEHPTQTLTDLLTIRSVKKRVGGLAVGCCGDLKFGRTVHSLVKNISRYEGVSFIFASPDELRIPRFLRAFLDDNGVEYVETDRMDGKIAEMDVLYMTRVQKERFFNEEEYIRLKDLFILDAGKLRSAKEDLCILHPLPRVNEIAYEVDADKRAAYFHQAGCGMYARMALMASLLGAV